MEEAQLRGGHVIMCDRGDPVPQFADGMEDFLGVSALDLLQQWPEFEPSVEPSHGVHKGNSLVNRLVSSMKAFPRPKLFVPPCGAPFLPYAHFASPWAGNLLPTILSNPGESSGSGGRAREERNGGGGNAASVKPSYGVHKGYTLVNPLAVVASTMSNCRPKLLGPLCGILLATILSNQGESSGSGGRAREGRNGGGGNGNQGILGGGVGGGGGRREGIGNERRGNRGSNHGGGNGGGDDDGNGRGAWVDFIEGEYSLAKILRFLIADMFVTLMSLDIHSLPARARIFRNISLGFNLAAIVCLWDSSRRRRTNPILARILSWIGIFATLLGFISMIALAFSASFAP